jgi:opacity protein-like surface antigen
MKRLLIIAGVLLLASFAFAADIDGKWAGTITGMDMPIEFTFKAEGQTLTGFHIVSGTETAIKDGKIDGNNISFSVSFDMGGQEMKMEFKGVLSGDNLKLSMDMMGQPMDFNLKRAK